LDVLLGETQKPGANRIVWDNIDYGLCRCWWEHRPKYHKQNHRTFER